MDISITFKKDQEAIAREHLAKVLASPMFVQAERQQRFLRYIAEETLAGRADKLKGYTIGVEVFDRDPSFDPTIDAIVRVEAGRLRTKLREYYATDGQHDRVQFELPKGAYKIFIHWGEEKPDENPSTNSASLLQTLVHSSSPDYSVPLQQIPDKPSLAILPFVNMSNDPDQEYFADGITDSLITELSRLGEFFIISRHSSFVYKGVSMRAGEIGKELGVRFLIDGSVQRSGKRVRIVANLVDSFSGAHLWSEHYDRQLEDIFELQDDVTRCIAAILQVKLSPQECQLHQRGGTLNMEAHDCLLRGLERLWTYERKGLEEAQAYFERTIILDPGYAHGHVWLARVLTAQWIFFWGEIEVSLDRALQHVTTALNIDPQLPIAHAVLGWIQRWRSQMDAALDAGRRAVMLDPNNADAHMFLSNSLVFSNFAAEGLHYIEKGILLNPHPSTLYIFCKGMAHLVLEDYVEAERAFKHGVRLNETFMPNHVWLCVFYTMQGRKEEAKVERDKLVSISGKINTFTHQEWLDESLKQRFRKLFELAELV